MLYIMMHRTQIYLDAELHQILAAAAARTGRTISDLIRERLSRAELTEPLVTPREAVAQAVGLWAGRTDLPDTATYVRHLRRDTHRIRRATPAPSRRRR
jgi:hypothetical protein